MTVKRREIVVHARTESNDNFFVTVVGCHTDSLLCYRDYIVSSCLQSLGSTKMAIDRFCAPSGLHLLCRTIPPSTPFRSDADAQVLIPCRLLAVATELWRWRSQRSQEVAGYFQQQTCGIIAASRTPLTFHLQYFSGIFFKNEFLKRNIADEARKKIVCVFIKTVIVMARTKSFAVISLVNFWIYICIDYFLYWW